METIQVPMPHLRKTYDFASSSGQMTFYPLFAKVIFNSDLGTGTKDE